METLNKIWNKLGQSNYLLPKAKSIEKVAVFGFADTKSDDQLFKEAFSVSFSLAKAGYTIVDGGGPGVMKAATLGAKSAGGRVIGVTFYPKDDISNYEGKDIENPIDQEIKTNSYIERTLTLMQEGQVYVVFNGASGTMSEFAMAWGLARLYFGHHKPIILYGKFWKKIMHSLKKNLMLRPEEAKVYKIVDSPEGVLKAILKFEEEISKGLYKHIKTSREESLVA